jgi:hypothetical protein
MKRLYQSMDKIRQSQIQSSILSTQNNHSILITNNHNEHFPNHFTEENNTTPTVECLPSDQS